MLHVATIRQSADGRLQNDAMLLAPLTMHWLVVLMAQQAGELKLMPS